MLAKECVALRSRIKELEHNHSVRNKQLEADLLVERQWTAQLRATSESYEVRIGSLDRLGTQLNTYNHDLKRVIESQSAQIGRLERREQLIGQKHRKAE